MSKTANAVKEPTALILVEFYEALSSVIEMLDTPEPHYVTKLLEKYEEKYGRNDKNR